MHKKWKKVNDYLIFIYAFPNNNTYYNYYYYYLINNNFFLKFYAINFVQIKLYIYIYII